MKSNNPQKRLFKHKIDFNRSISNAFAGQGYNVNSCELKSKKVVMNKRTAEIIAG